MPGMMDTILNLGLTDESVEGLAKLTNNPRFAYDSYRRIYSMFADVVMEIKKENFEALMDHMKEVKGVTQDTELDANDLKRLVSEFKVKYAELKGEPFPQDPNVQLLEAVKAVFRSWDNPRANVYRRLNNIPYSWGTAVNVQSMVLVIWERILVQELPSQEILLLVKMFYMESIYLMLKVKML